MPGEVSARLMGKSTVAPGSRGDSLLVSETGNRTYLEVTLTALWHSKNSVVQGRLKRKATHAETSSAPPTQIRLLRQLRLQLSMGPLSRRQDCICWGMHII